MCASAVQFLSLDFMINFQILTTGPGHTGAALVPSFAKSSAVILPLIQLWPDTYVRDTCLLITKVFRSDESSIPV